MESRLLFEGQEKVYVLIFDSGEEPVNGLTDFARQHQVTDARFTAIGGFSEVTLGYFDWQTKGYQHIPVQEQVEVLSLIGDISMWQDKPMVHAHVVVGRYNGETRGGHLLQARVRPTLEVMLTVSPTYLRRCYNQEAGLPLICPDRS